MVDAVTHAWTGRDALAAGIPASRIRPDAVVPGKAARWLLAIGDEWARWDLEARAERAYWELGGPGPDAVKVTASGWVDASAWQLRGGLAGIGPEGFAQGGHGDGMAPGPLLGVLLEQAVTGGPEFGTVAGVPVTQVESTWEAGGTQVSFRRGMYPVFLQGTPSRVGQNRDGSVRGYLRQPEGGIV